MYCKRFCFVAVALVASLPCFKVTQAKKPDKPPGGGGDTASYTLVTLDDRAGYVRGLVRDVEIVDGTITCVGYLDEADGDKAVMWEVTPTASGYDVTTRYLVGGEFAAALNANGEAVGQHGTFNESTKLWLHSGLYWPNPNGTPMALAPLAGDNETEPLGINAAGLIVGCSTYKYATYDENGDVVDVFEEQTAVVWRTDIVDANGKLAPFVLGNQPGIYCCRRGYDINKCDTDGFAQVVGIGEAGPVIWQVDCATLASTGPVSLLPENMVAHGTARGINNAGDACGVNTSLAFRRLADGTFEELPVRRNNSSIANDINDQRQVVGQVWEWNNTGGLSKTYGAMWQGDGKRVDLNKFLGRSGWRHLHEGLAINTGGIIAASGSLNADGESRALLMIPN